MPATAWSCVRGTGQTADGGRIEEVAVHITIASDRPRETGATAAPAVEVVDLRRRYGGFEAVRGISFEVWPGEVFALLGVNGAGKTSALEVLEGLALASGGSVRV